VSHSEECILHSVPEPYQPIEPGMSSTPEIQKQQTANQGLMRHSGGGPPDVKQALAATLSLKTDASSFHNAGPRLESELAQLDC